MDDKLQKSQDKFKPDMAVNQRNVCCPIHKRLIGKYDCRVGIINTTYYCPTCRIEYTFTIEPDKK